MNYAHIICIMACAFLSLDIAVSSPPQAESEVSSHSQTDERDLKNRIIGGTVANAKRYPYYTYLSISFRSGLSSFCGGSLVNSDVVLTAAHCINPSSNDPIEKITALVNYTRNKAVTGYLTGFEHSRSGIAYVKHRDYDMTKNNDIGLVFLDSPVNAVTPVKLNNNGNVPSVGEPVTVVGHGRISNAATNVLPQYLMEVSVPIVSFQDCNDQNSYWGGIVDQSMICAGASVGGKGACNGDSGGPLIIRGSEATQDLQVGIVSWGTKTCAIVDHPSVFTRVSTYRKWVQDYICQYSKVKPSSCSNVPRPASRPTPAPTVRQGQTRPPTPEPTEAPIAPNSPVSSPSYGQSPSYSW
jgi:secreted trypsin-like serine protease